MTSDTAFQQTADANPGGRRPSVCSEKGMPDGSSGGRRPSVCSSGTRSRRPSMCAADQHRRDDICPDGPDGQKTPVIRERRPSVFRRPSVPLIPVLHGSVPEPEEEVDDFIANRPSLKDLPQLHCEESSGCCLQAGVCTATGARPSNEDAHICISNWCGDNRTKILRMPVGLFAVCDGHGGSAVSRHIASELSGILHQHMHALRTDHDALEVRKKAVVEAFLEMDESVREHHGEAAIKCGSTCTAAIIWPPDDDGNYRVLLANLGDSRGILYRTEDDELEETTDHKPDDPEEEARIEKAGGKVIKDDLEPPRIEGDLALSRAFGDFRHKADRSRKPEEQKVSPVPDIYEFDAKTGDIVVLGCDGIYDVILSDEVASLVADDLSCDGKHHKRSPMEAAATLVYAALQCNTGDNVTGLVVKLGQQGSEETRQSSKTTSSPKPSPRSDK